MMAGAPLRGVIESGQQLKGIDNKLNKIILENSEVVQHVVDNWASALTPGFWRKFFIIRVKQGARRRLITKYLRAILSPSSTFVMNVETVKNWQNNLQSALIVFTDTEILQLYNTIIALKHDPDFLEFLQACNAFVYHYFLDKVPFIEKHRDLFEGRQVQGLLDYPQLQKVLDNL
jgi:hypothetical protein